MSYMEPTNASTRGYITNNVNAIAIRVEPAFLLNGNALNKIPVGSRTGSAAAWIKSKSSFWTKNAKRSGVKAKLRDERKLERKENGEPGNKLMLNLMKKLTIPVIKPGSTPWVAAIAVANAFTIGPKGNGKLTINENITIELDVKR